MFGYLEFLLIMAFVLVILVAVGLLLRYYWRRRQARVVARLTQGHSWPVYPATITAVSVINDFQVQVAFFVTLDGGKRVSFEDVFGISEFMVMRSLAIEYDEQSGSYQFVDDLAVPRVEEVPVLEVGASVVDVSAHRLLVETKSIFPLRLAVPVRSGQEAYVGETVTLLVNPLAPVKDVQLRTVDEKRRQ